MEISSHQENQVGHPTRILMLVPHEPEQDPRIKWVTDVCRDLGLRTDILGCVFATQKPLREFDGLIYLERIRLYEYASPQLQLLLGVLTRIISLGKKFTGLLGHIQRLFSRRPALVQKDEGASSVLQGKFLAGDSSSLWGQFLYQMQEIARFIYALPVYGFLATSLYRRARTASIIPQLIICHDIFALAASVWLKELWDCPVIYDSHEFWPEANLLAPKWEVWVTTKIESFLIKKADAVVSVSPQLALHLQKLYDLKQVICVANAEPFFELDSLSCQRPLSHPVKFLLQGSVAPGRGIEEFLLSWKRLGQSNTILYLRCPENEYLLFLKEKFRDLLVQERVIILPPVSESELVSAASFADVGVIPYPGPNLNHVYACPNKLSQYMQAGLAIFSNHDSKFVSEIVTNNQCGVTYSNSDPEAFRSSIEFIANDLGRLQKMKENACQTAKIFFNWETQSVAYKSLIQKYLTK